MSNRHESNSKPNSPFVIEGGAGGSFQRLLTFLRDNHEAIEGRLLDDGAILFRGFGVNTPSSFLKCVRSISGDLLDYVDGNSPRTRIASGIYTSTEYPAQYSISLHNELSYAHKWPAALYFCCVVAAAEGGQTPIADCRAILRDLNPDVVDEFSRKQVKYIRNLHGGHGPGPSWQDTFECADSATVERYCGESGIVFEWKKDGSLRLVQVRPATVKHPKTGGWVWFNQADQFHPSTHPATVFENLMQFFNGRVEDLPQNACFGDDTPIDVSALDHIREVSRRHAVLFPWQEGDLLMIDNVLTCHGRMPFTGPRKILVAMS
jgi:alpha-ketoglutarate-dependent taurine dioxygenase